MTVYESRVSTNMVYNYFNHKNENKNEKQFPKKSRKITNNMADDSLYKKSENMYTLVIISGREPPQSFVGSPPNLFLDHLDKRIGRY